MPASPAGTPGTPNSGWIPLQRVAEDLAVPVEEVRVSAELDLNLDVYDPNLDMVTEDGRQRIRDLFSFYGEPVSPTTPVPLTPVDGPDPGPDLIPPTLPRPA